MDLLCHLKIKRANIWIIGESKASDQIQIKIEMQNPSQEPLASSKVPYVDLNVMDVLCTFKTNVDSQNSKDGFVKDQ